MRDRAAASSSKPEADRAHVFQRLTISQPGPQEYASIHTDDLRRTLRELRRKRSSVEWWSTLAGAFIGAALSTALSILVGAVQGDPDTTIAWVSTGALAALGLLTIVFRVVHTPGGWSNLEIADDLQESANWNAGRSDERAAAPEADRVEGHEAKIDLPARDIPAIFRALRDRRERQAVSPHNVGAPSRQAVAAVERYHQLVGDVWEVLTVAEKKVLAEFIHLDKPAVQRPTGDGAAESLVMHQLLVELPSGGGYVLRPGVRRWLQQHPEALAGIEPEPYDPDNDIPW